MFAHLLIAALVASGSLASTDGPCGVPITWATIGKRVDVLHTLNTTKEVAQPAFVQYQKPDSGDVAVTVNAALRFDACSNSLLSIGPFLEYGWNTVAKKRQNSIRTGLDVDWQVLKVSRTAYSISPLLLMQANYKQDNEHAIKSGQGTVLVTLVSRNRRWPAPNATWRPNKWFDFSYAPLLGITVDAITNAQDPSKEGTVTRGILKIDAVLYPAAIKIHRQVELTSSYTFWKDLQDNTSENQDRHRYLRYGVNVFVIKDESRAAGLTVARITGEDVQNSFASQRLWQFGATLRIK